MFYSQVQWVEEDDQVLALVVLQANILEGSVDDSGALEGGRFLLNLRRHVSGWLLL